MIGNACRIILASLVVATATGCDTVPNRDVASRGREGAARERGRKAEEPRTVLVPTLCVEQVQEFFGREQLLLADRVVIDASADPFFATTAVVADPSSVKKTEAVDAAKRISILRLENRSGQTTIESALPQLRIGGGFQVVATREILVRFHQTVRAARPIFLDVSADGEVLYSDTHATAPVRARRLGLAIEVRQEGTGYMFASRAR